MGWASRANRAKAQKEAEKLREAGLDAQVWGQNGEALYVRPQNWGAPSFDGGADYLDPAIYEKLNGSVLRANNRS